MWAYAAGVARRAGGCGVADEGSSLPEQKRFRLSSSKRVAADVHSLGDRVQAGGAAEETLAYQGRHRSCLSSPKWMMRSCRSCGLVDVPDDLPPSFALRVISHPQQFGCRQVAACWRERVGQSPGRRDLSICGVIFFSVRVKPSRAVLRACTSEVLAKLESIPPTDRGSSNPARVVAPIKVQRAEFEVEVCDALTPSPNTHGRSR